MTTSVLPQTLRLVLLVGLVSANTLLFEHASKSRRYKNIGLDPEVFMNATELVTSKGYPCENHFVTTGDGYILNLLRIPHGLNNSQTKAQRPVVVLQHGFLGSATNWLTNPANESLAYILADAGADVWLGNSRGSIYSMNHTRLSPRDDAFWDFSWDEMAKFDLPATINFVVSTTGVAQVYYVGHSQGTTMAFARLSEDPGLSAHIAHFMALAPIARIGNAQTPLRKIAPLAKSNRFFYSVFGRRDFLLTPEQIRVVQGELCQRLTTVCANIFFLLGGFDKASLNMTRIPVYDAHVPAGTSTKDVLHWAQAMNSNKFQKYDFGSAEENQKHYNQSSPPLYQPAKIKVPVAFFRGGADLLADDEDINWLLPQVKVTKDVYIKHYEHLDFIWAFDAPSLIYDDVLKIVFNK